MNYAPLQPLTAKALAFGDDFGSFLDPLSYEPDGPTALSHSFYSDFPGSLRDAQLESPLGLDLELDQSPYDYGYEYSPSFDSPSSLSGLTTPEFARGGDLPSLFGFEFGAAVPVWVPEDVDRIVAPIVLAVSPLMTRLPSVEVEEVQKEEEDADFVEEPVRPAKKADGKDKFNGTRNTKIAAIPIDAPTMSRSYVLPSSTSRKRSAPTAAAPAPKQAKAARAARRPSTPFEGKDEEYEASDLPEEVLDAISAKRRSNTLAARVSRNRKAEFLQSLQSDIVRLTAERDEWKEKAMEAERQLAGRS